MAVALYTEQLEAVEKLQTGSVLCGGVGSGKTRTALVYYYIKVLEGTLRINGFGTTTAPKHKVPLYVITTGKTRDDGSWEKEALSFYSVEPIVDSWNNIKKYVNIKNAFFIFDEQRVVGNGEWAKAFKHIAKNNEWILLSATPGDSWIELAQIFIANGFYRNLTDFKQQHVVYSPYTSYPKIEHYVNVKKLERLRDRVIVAMDDRRITLPHHVDYRVKYDKKTVQYINKEHKNPETNKPIKTASEFCFTIRRVVNSDKSRLQAVLDIMSKHPKVIIFYNYDYELYNLKDCFLENGIVYSEWNGHFHKPIPESDKWAYLVQYSAGAEGWNCILTDTTIFYSNNYSYKIMQQAAGRINRINTPYIDLYYYHLVSDSQIDKAITQAVLAKKRFNESAFCKHMDC